MTASCWAIFLAACINNWNRDEVIAAFFLNSFYLIIINRFGVPHLNVIPERFGEPLMLHYLHFRQPDPIIGVSNRWTDFLRYYSMPRPLFSHEMFWSLYHSPFKIQFRCWFYLFDDKKLPVSEPNVKRYIDGAICWECKWIVVRLLTIYTNSNRWVKTTKKIYFHFIVYFSLSVLFFT